LRWKKRIDGRCGRLRSGRGPGRARGRTGSLRQQKPQRRLCARLKDLQLYPPPLWDRDGKAHGELQISDAYTSFLMGRACPLHHGLQHLALYPIPSSRWGVGQSDRSGGE
jgi:hypothetical protein